MNNICKRGISGTIFVAIIVACCFEKWAFLSLVFFMMQVCIFEFSKAKSSFLFLISTLLYVFFIIDNLPLFSIKKYIFGMIIFSVLLVFIKVLLRKKTNPISFLGHFFLTLLYVCVPFIFIAKMPFINAQKTFQTPLILSIFILIWVGDTFAYLFGKFFGKRKLFKSISPNKTLEGFLAGVFFTIVFGMFIPHFFAILSLGKSFFLSMIICIFAPLGDLIASMFKRQMGSKDFGNILPGHGGFLDRLDSILFAAPLIYVFLNFMTDVS